MVSTRKLQIMTVARRLLAERGFEGTTMADIAGELGLVESALYRHFKSKNDLFVETLHTFYEPLVDEMEDFASATSDPVQLLRLVIWRHIRSYAEEPELNQLVVIQARRTHAGGGFDQEITAMNRRYASVLTRTLQDGKNQGLFRSDVDVRLVRDMVFGTIEHAWLTSVARSQPMDVESLTEQVHQLVLGGISAEPAAAPSVGRQLEELRTAVDDLTAQMRRAQDGAEPPARRPRSARAVG